MSGRLRVSVAAVIIAMAGALGALLAYLLQQGLARASLWATVLVLPLTVIATVAGVWAAILAAQALRHSQALNERPSAEDAVDPPSIARSGDVRQEHMSGPAIAHTGVGDIIFTASEAVIPSDEST
jgi:hypothetical protein